MGMESLERHEMRKIKGDLKVDASVKTPNSKRATRLFHWGRGGLTMWLYKYIKLIYVCFCKLCYKSHAVSINVTQTC